VTRALKKQWPLPASGTFFTTAGSVRKKADAEALEAAVIYVARKQPDALATFIGNRWLPLFAAYD
jgi:hypothetical protein